MSEYTIYFTSTASCSIKVEADDLEAAIEEAWQEAPSGVCAQCSGMGSHSKFSLDLSGDWDVDDSGYEVDGEYIEVSS
jgi:excinuclease UvrABC ATPase subunit